VEGLVKIELGCGERKQPDFDDTSFIRIDIRRTKRTDLICDLTKGLPFKDNCVDEVYSSHFLEHLTHLALRDLLNDIVRVCKNGSEVISLFPYWNHETAMFPAHTYTLPPEFWRHLEMYRDYWFYRKYGYMVIKNMVIGYTDDGLKFCEKLGINPEEGARFLNNIAHHMIVTMEVKK